MQGLYGRAYGTLTSNVENLTPAAQGGGLQPLQLSRWTGQSKWASVATWNTPPAPASPTVPFPGQPQYGLQQSPNYAPVIGYGSADYEVGYAGARGYGDAYSVQTSAFAKWIGSGSWEYLLDYANSAILAKSPTKTQWLRPGTYGYKAVLTEAKSLPGARSDTLYKISNLLSSAPAETRSPEIVTATAPPAAPAPSSAPPAPSSAPPAPSTRAEGLTTGQKVALAVLGASVMGGVVLWMMRRRRRA